MKNFFCKFIKAKTGSITVFVGIAMVVILGMGALITDMGVQYISANQLQNAVDASALAGTEKLPLSDDSKWGAEVVPVAKKYAQMNGLDSVVVSPIKNSKGKIVGVEVNAEKTVNNMFIKVLSTNNDTVDISRRAVARVFTVSEVSKGSGLIPIGVNKKVLDDPAFDGSIPLDITPDVGNGYKYSWMNYNGGSSSNAEIKEWLENGYDGTVEIGNIIPFDTGSRASSVMEYNELNGKNVLVPVYESVGTNAKIVGFVMAKVESYQPGKKNKNMKATFVKYANITGLPSGNEDIEEYSVYGTRLVE